VGIALLGAGDPARRMCAMPTLLDSADSVGIAPENAQLETAVVPGAMPTLRN